MRLLKLTPLNKHRVEIDLKKAIKLDSDSDIDVKKILNKILIIQSKNKTVLNSIENVIATELNVDDAIVILNSYENELDKISFFFLEDIDPNTKFDEEDIIVI